MRVDKNFEAYHMRYIDVTLGFLRPVGGAAA